MQFRTHTGEIITGERLSDAFNKVANDWAELHKAIRMEDKYASHVSETQKEDNLIKGLEAAENIRQGNISTFTIWQRVNTCLTGKCVALLPA